MGYIDLPVVGGGGGGVATVTATAPVASSGGANPDISISQSSAVTDGYLSAVDWSTFNSKQSALTLGNLTELTSSVLTITGGTGAVIGSGTTIQVSQAGVATSGYLSSTDWNTFNNKQPAGTYVTSVGATAPVASSGGTTPTISMAQSSALADGYLSSVDWSTFNAKMTNPMNAAGQIIYGGVAGAPQALAAGTSEYILTSNGTTVEWRINGTGSSGAAYPTNSLIVGKVKPAGFTSQQSIILGTGTTGNVSTGINNILIGHNCGAGITSSTDNVIIGSGAGTSITTSTKNVVIGANANTSTTQSVVIGESAAITAGLTGTVVGCNALSRGNFGCIFGGGSASGTGTSNTIVGVSSGRNNASGSDNIFLGLNVAYQAWTTGSRNVLAGTNSGTVMTTASDNVAIGYLCLDALTTGTNNTCVGSNAGGALTTGKTNVYIGHNAGLLATTSENNVFVGNNAGQSDTSSGANTFIGVNAGQGVTTGNWQVAVGFAALQASTTGVGNTALGFSALRFPVTSNNNTALGYNALRGANVAPGCSDNTGAGYQALTAITTGVDNCAFGSGAGDAVTSGNNLVLIGKNAGGAVTTGVTSVMIGSSAGLVHTTPDRLVLIGDNAGAAMTSGARTIAIGNLALGGTTGTSFTVAIGSQALTSCTGNNNVGIGQAAGINLSSGADNCLIGNNVGRSLATGAADLSTAGSNVIIGSQASGSANNITNGIALGRNSVTNSSAFAVGGISAAIDTVFLGTGAAPTTVAQAVKIQTQSASGTDTDLSTSTLTLAGSRSTGNKDGGAVILSTAPAGASGTTLNAHVERMRVTAAGDVGIGTNAPNVRLDVQNTTAATNTVTNILRVDSQSSGTPAAGIGVGIQMAAETAAGNTEVGVVLEAVTTDVTAGSEDFDFVVKNMAAGAAATETLRVTSVGDTKVTGGNLSVETVGKGLRIKTGTNATAGKETGISSVSTVTINTTAVTASSLIFVQPMNSANTHGFTVDNIVAGTSFDVDFSGNYTGDLAWMIVEPA